MSVPFLQWNDPYEWTEKNTVKTRTAIQKENRLFKQTVADSATKANLEKKLREFQKAYESNRPIQTIKIPSYGEPRVLVEVNTIQEEVLRWKYAKQGAWVHANSVDVSEDVVAYTSDSSDLYDYKLYVRTPRRLWTHAHGGGPYVAILGKRDYFLEEDRLLQ